MSPRPISPKQFLDPKNNFIYTSSHHFGEGHARLVSYRLTMVTAKGERSSALITDDLEQIKKIAQGYFEHFEHDRVAEIHDSNSEVLLYRRRRGERWEKIDN